jgi:S-sulfosulfanyl-L-cysteine sulfohydrolase
MSKRTITLIQVNDVHAYLDLHPEIFYEKGTPVYRHAGGYARIKSLVRQIRSRNPASLFLDNGDTFHGTYPAVSSKGQALVPLLNQLGLDGMTAHWEFAYGPAAFQKLAEQLDYPVLALNVKRKDTGERPFPGWMVREAGSLRVGVIGLASNIVDKTMPASFSEGLRFELGREDLPEAIETLRGQERVELLVVLSHLGYPQDLQLAADVPGIDVLLSGHTHNRLGSPVRQGQTLLIQSGSHGSFVGQLDLSVENGQVTAFEHTLHEVTQSIEPDREAQALVQEILAPHAGMLEEVTGETAAPLDRSLNLESTMDNLVLKAIAESSEIQLAFSNGWRYGAPILPGPVSLNDLYNIIPVNPPVVTVEISGQELRDMLEENLEHSHSRDPYGQMGGYVKRSLGVRVYFKVENPYPHRIQNLFVGDEEVRPQKRYKAAFVTDQGVPAKYGENRQKLDLKAVDALRAYLQKNSPISTGLEGTFVLV